MNINTITISRQFGSGGRTVGELLADKLGVSFYDRELVRKVAMDTGYSEPYIENLGEHSPYKSIIASIFSNKSYDIAQGGVSSTDQLWSVQNRIIKQIADSEPCVIIGRCSDYILRDRDNVLNVFIHADVPFRAKRIVEVYGETESNPEKRLKEIDKKRASYYTYYTEKEWGDLNNYHICLDSGVIGIERCADIIAGMVEMFKNS